MITQRDFIALALCCPTLKTHFRRGINVKFVRSIGENDRTDVSSFHDQIIVACILMQLTPDNLPNHRQPADARNIFVHTIITEMFCWIDAIDQDAQLGVPKTARNRYLFEGSADAVGIFDMDPFLEDMPGDRSVDGTGINIDKTEPPGEFSRDTALARGSRTINRDHLLKNLPRGMHETEVPSLVAPPAELQ